MTVPQVRLDGVREIQRAFRAAGGGMQRAIPEALEAAGEPVKQSAESLAVTEIPRIALPGTKVAWHKMRIGVKGNVGYMVPLQRGDKSRRGSRRRQKFGQKLLHEAMEPAVERNLAAVEREFREALGDVLRLWERVAK